MHQLYSCLVLVVCASFVLTAVDESIFTDDLKKLMDSLHSTCVDQTKVDEADITKLRAGEFADNEQIKCYVKCILSESGAMDESGDIDYKALDEVVPEQLRETVRKDFKSCTPKGEGIADHCEKAYTIVQCVYKADPDTFYYP